MTFPAILGEVDCAQRSPYCHCIGSVGHLGRSYSVDAELAKKGRL